MHIKIGGAVGSWLVGWLGMVEAGSGRIFQHNT
jgi:hypothetical protein